MRTLSASKIDPFSVLQNEARLEWYGTRHERSKPRASGLRKHDDADQKRDQQGSNGKNNLAGRPLVRFFEPAARSVPPSNFVLRRFLLISVQLCPPYATSGGTGWGCGDGASAACGVVFGPALEAPTVISGLNDIAMVSEAIEQRGGHFRIAEHRKIPLFSNGWSLRLPLSTRSMRFSGIRFG